jgi:16S rRNA G966 N2-methylase RsmD
VIVSSLCVQKFKSASITSLEADAEWLCHTKKYATKNIECNKNVSAIDINLIKISYEIDDLQNKINILKDGPKFDVVFIDAPPDKTMPNARKIVANMLVGLLSEKGVLIMHDTNRAEELFAIEDMKSSFLQHELYSTKKGIGVLRFPKID